MTGKGASSKCGRRSVSGPHVHTRMYSGVGQRMLVDGRISLPCNVGHRTSSPGWWQHPVAKVPNLVAVVPSYWSCSR